MRWTLYLLGAGAVIVVGVMALLIYYMYQILASLTDFWPKH